jgi:hypothetical protein
MHVVGYLYEDYHDARPLEHKVNEHKKAANFPYSDSHNFTSQSPAVFSQVHFTPFSPTPSL